MEWEETARERHLANALSSDSSQTQLLILAHLHQQDGPLQGVEIALFVA